MAAKSNLDEITSSLSNLGINEPGKKIYVIGGISGIECNEIVSYRGGRFTTNLQLPSLALKYFALVNVKGRLYAIGGRDPNNIPLNTITCFNDATQKWSRLPVALLQKRSESGASVIDDVIYITGGFDSCNSAEMFDPSTMQRTNLPNMIHGRWGHQSIAIGNRLYVIGGHRFRSYFNSVECLEGGKWRSCEGMNRRRAYFGAVVRQDKIYVFGGFGGVCNSNQIQRLDSIEMYDVANDTWTEIGHLDAATSNLSAYLLSDSQAILVGGLEDDKRKNRIIKIFNFDSNSFLRPTYSLKTWRFAHSVIVL
ncbi:Kelch-like protein 17 [Chamberlinius hualienensis]